MSYQLEIRNFADTSQLEELKASNKKITSIPFEWEINGVQQIEFTAVRTELDDPDNIEIGNIVRCIYYDGSTNAYTTYRIKKVKPYRSGVKTFIYALAEHLKYDLKDDFIREPKKFYMQSRNDILDWILTDSDWSRGTITDGTNIVSEFEVAFGMTRFDAVKLLADETGLETYYHADGTSAGHESDYQKIDLCIVNNTKNGTPGTASFVKGTNLLRVDYEKDIRDKFATRIYAIGGSANPGARLFGLNQYITMTVESAEFIVKSYDNATGWITFYSDNILAEDDALNGYEVFCHGPNAVQTGLPATITDSEKTSDGDKVRVNTAVFSTTPNEGDICIFYDGVNALDFVPNAVKESAYWSIGTTYEDNELDDYVNMLGPHGRADMSDYIYGICKGWGLIGSPSTSESTDTSYIVNGTSCQEVIADDGEGIYKEFDLELSTGQESQISFYVWITVTSLDADTYVDVRVRSHNDGANNVYIPNEGLLYETGGTTRRGIDYTASAPNRVIVEGFTVKYDGSTTQRLEILAVGGSATFYVDSVLLVKNNTILGYENFTVHDSRARLWERAVRKYRAENSLTQKYTCEILDLYEKNHSTYSAYEFLPGDSVTLTDSSIGIDGTVRIIRKSGDYLDNGRGAQVDIDIVNKGDAYNLKNLDKQTTRLVQSGNSTRKASEKRSEFSNIGLGGVIVEDYQGQMTRAGRQMSRKLINAEYRQKQADGSYTKVNNKW